MTPYIIGAVVGVVLTLALIIGVLYLFAWLEPHASIGPDERDRDYT